MKRIFVLLLMMAMALSSLRAQVAHWETYSQTYTDGVYNKGMQPGFITAVPMLNNVFWNLHSNNELKRSLLTDSTYKRNHAANPLTVATFDTAKARFFFHGVDASSITRYEYRVMLDDKQTLIPWRSISTLTSAAFNQLSGLAHVAYLGGYRTAIGHSIMVDVRRKGGQRAEYTSVVQWYPVKPVITAIYDSNDFNLFFTRLTRSWAVKEDPVKPQNFIEPSTNSNLVFLLNTALVDKHQLEYELLKDGQVAVPWRQNDYDNGFVWLKGFAPGRYTVKIRFTAQPQHVTEYCFRVVQPKVAYGPVKIVSVIAVAGFAVFLILLFRQRHKTRKEQVRKARLQLEMKALYAQLNPHFVFNALSSIQGLINRQDLEGANRYLADFARLMREALQNEEKNEIPLAQEIQMLNTYLKLEQLRFGFRYAITADEQINTYETNIPALLLQPLVENAVKHGVSALSREGTINITLTRQGNALQVTITDNGSGFNSGNHPTGFGLKLTHDRLQLLNQLQPERPITFKTDTGSITGTQVLFTFNHWFL